MLCSAVTLEPIPISSTNFSKSVLTSWCVYVRAKYNPCCPTACFTQEWVKKVQHSIFCWLVTLSSASPLCCTSGCSIAGGWWKCHLGMRWPRYLIVLLLGDGVCHLFVALSFQSLSGRPAEEFFSCAFALKDLGIQSLGFQGGYRWPCSINAQGCVQCSAGKTGVI